MQDTWLNFIDFFTGTFTWSELKSWMVARDITLNQWEIDVFRGLAAKHAGVKNA